MALPGESFNATGGFNAAMDDALAEKGLGRHARLGGKCMTVRFGTSEQAIDDATTVPGALHDADIVLAPDLSACAVYFPSPGHVEGEEAAEGEEEEKEAEPEKTAEEKLADIVADRLDEAPEEDGEEEEENQKKKAKKAQTPQHPCWALLQPRLQPSDAELAEMLAQPSPEPQGRLVHEYRTAATAAAAGDAPTGAAAAAEATFRVYAGSLEEVRDL
eukprot:Rhum_TRINITY_DN14542_c8_g1::Rhum_TRINITY_DN14542_c8_g1_i1::g.97553::m.97553